jgi:peroxiredoxin
MAQLRQDYDAFIARDAEIVVVGPDDQRAFQDYWRKEELPFVGLADPAHTVARRYGQEVKLLRAGRMPALLVIDKAGQVVYAHYGGAMYDIPPNREILDVLDGLNQTVDRKPAPAVEDAA